MKQVSKIFSLGILFLFVCTLNLSAQKCKFDYNKPDPISGEATKGNTFRIGDDWKLGFSRIGDIYYVEMNYKHRGEQRDVLQENDPMTIKLSNGEIITITAQEHFIPYLKITNILHSYYHGKYKIDAATLQKIAEYSPTFIRINIGTKVYNHEIVSGLGKKISQAATCILQ